MAPLVLSPWASIRSLCTFTPHKKSGSPRRLLSNLGHPKSSFNQKPPPNLIVGVESKSISKNVKMVKMLSRLPDKSRLGANHWVTGEESHDLTVMREQSSSQFRRGRHRSEWHGQSGKSPQETEPFASFDSPQLLELAAKVNHYSNNFYGRTALESTRSQGI